MGFFVGFLENCYAIICHAEPVEARQMNYLYFDRLSM